MFRRIITIALLGFTLLGLGSCSKFLDIQPVGKVIPNSLEEYRALLGKAYVIPQLDRGLVELRTDIAQLRNQALDRNAYGDIERWADANPAQGTQPFGWQSYYEAIYYANAVIDQQAKISGGSEADIRQLVGEAYLLRAYLHFVLVNLYGRPYTQSGSPESLAVPIKLGLDLDVVQPRNTVKEVYTQVLADIKEAEQRITQERWEEALRYRFSKASVLALRSRVLLYMGAWAEAQEATEQALALHSELADLTQATPTLPNRYNSPEVITAYEQIFTSSVGRAIRATDAFVNSYEAEDARRALFFGEKDATQGYYAVTKVDGTTAYRCSFRTSELYLTLSEVATRQGNLTLAREQLLKLLAKRYTSVAYTALEARVASMAQAELLELVLSERTKELAFEGHRWFDLRRTSRPELTKTIADVTYTLSADDARYTLRIPAEAIASNSLLAN